MPMGIAIFIIVLVVIIIVIARSRGTSSADPGEVVSINDVDQAALEEFDGVFDDQFDTDPYLVFDGPLSSDTPAEFLPLMQTIRRESAWRQVFGKRLRKDRDGNYDSIVVDGYYYGFTPIVVAEAQEQAAISSGKKLAYRPDDVANWVFEFGFTVDDFAQIPDDYKDYVQALQLAESGELEKAISLAEAAAAARPDETSYPDLVTELKLKSGDTGGVDDAIAYYENDMDSAVHGGDAHGWLRALVEANQHAKAVGAIERIDALLEDLVEGRRTNRIYGGQSREFVVEKRAQFHNGLGSAVDLGKSADLAAPSVDQQGLRELCRVVLRLDSSPKARLFAQRCADAFASGSDTETAREFYEAALRLARGEEKPRVIETLEKRLASL
ncbi:MAG: hypothetical protein ABIK85_05460 [Candidatus Eisenbacteria bacterium]